ncbi:MAG TPA: response regulator [Candidatus Eisenbacteria bacterium]|jgi:PAS domain S-box-containing protein
MNDRSRPVRSGLPAFAPAIGLRDVLEASPDLVFSTDAWGRLVWASSAFEAFTGRRVKDCVGTACTSLVVPAQVPGVLRALLRLERQGAESVDRVIGLLRTDGTVIEVDARLRFANSAEGERYLVGVARERTGAAETPAPAPTSAIAPDFTPAIAPDSAPGASELEPRVAELEQSLAEARESARAKGDFLAVMSHEIRTPMSGVIGMTNMLLQGELPAEARQLVELIQQSTQTLLALINDSLDFSRLEAGRMPVEQLDFDLRVTIDQVAGVLHALATPKALAFDSRVNALVPSRLKGDPGRLRQVLLNLGSNAVKFTESGSVSLRVEREAEDDAQVTLFFQLTDTGVGIDPAAQATLFEPYAQADSTIARRFGGSGLGLAISKRLVEAMGGELGVESAPNEGSTFWFRLRLEKQPVQAGGLASPNSEVALRGVRVLVADGNPGDREPLVGLLQAWGCEVERAENGPEALRMVRDAAAAGTPYAVAVFDRHLELMNGEELGQAVRADSALDGTRLVMVTNVGRPGDGGRVKAAGFAAYLMKPLDPAQLYDALGEVLQPGAEGADAEARPLVTRHSLAEARRGKLRLLLVDDDPVNQLVTTSALHRVGYNIDVANNGRRAIELTEDQRWDLILMDLQMPDLDGCRTTAAIRARERGAWRTPILGLTANADYKPDRDRCLAAGMDLVLGKPINLELLTSTVEKFTSRDGRVADPDAAPALPPRLTVVSSQFESPLLAAPAASRQTLRLAREAAPEAPAREVPAVPDGPAIDLEQLETACMGLPALRSSLLHTFLGDVSGRLERLAHAFETGDPRRVEFEAHGLKGMCATIGAGGCTMLFGEIEEWARDEHVDEARAMLQPAIDEVHRTEQFIRRFDSIITRDAA